MWWFVCHPCLTQPHKLPSSFFYFVKIAWNALCDLHQGYDKAKKKGSQQPLTCAYYNCQITTVGIALRFYMCPHHCISVLCSVFFQWTYPLAFPYQLRIYCPSRRMYIPPCINKWRKIVVYCYLNDCNGDLFCGKLHDKRNHSWQGVCPPSISFALMRGFSF